MPFPLDDRLDPRENEESWTYELVAFTRNPSTGENSFFGEFLINAQGEDVVAGTRTPQYITKKAKKESGSKENSLQEIMPKVYKQLIKTLKLLERHSVIIARVVSCFKFRPSIGSIWKPTLIVILTKLLT